jgi:glycerol uptake facilitator-like aquaporin
MRYFAEGLGTFLLVAVVVGSGIMAESLSNGNDAIALIGNTLATGAILYVLIKMFSSISGAHFNPAVSFIFFLKNEIELKDFLCYILVQVVSGVIAVFTIHYIFEIQIFQISQNFRGEFPLLVSEIIATSGLVMTILFIRKNDEDSVALGVALFITAGYWFTSSTSFANPAVTIARIFTDTFTGISIRSFPYFVIGQIIGSIIGLYIYRLFEINRD